MENTDHVDMFYLSLADEARKLPPEARLHLLTGIVKITTDELRKHGQLTLPIPPQLQRQ